MSRQKIQLFSFMAVLLATILLCSSFFRITEDFLILSTEVSGEIDPQKTVIILDAGHGGEDGGATGTNGVLEKDLNLMLTAELASMLRLAGCTVIETRTEDALLYDEGTKKGHKKQGDLENRLAVTEKYENCIFISIHMNTFPNQTCEGVQVWYSQNNDKSVELAKAVQISVKQMLQPNNHRKIKAATSSIYVLRHAQVPAILIECGFLSTPAECERLCDPLYRQELTAVLFSAISEKVIAQS